MELIHELLGYEHLKIIQRTDMFCFSLDSMLLADFVLLRSSTPRIIDLCCGNAPIPLFLSLKTQAPIIGVELQPEVADLARRSVLLNRLENQITIVDADINGVHRLLGANIFDVVTANPPHFRYQPTSNVNKNDFQTIARHEVKITLAALVQEARALCRDGATFALVHRSCRIAEVIAVLHANRFGIKRLRFVYPKKSSEKALLALIEARQNRPDDTVVLPPLYIYDEDNRYGDEVRQIFNFKEDNKHR